MTRNQIHSTSSTIYCIQCTTINMLRSVSERHETLTGQVNINLPKAVFLKVFYSVYLLAFHQNWTNPQVLHRANIHPSCNVFSVDL